MSQSFKLVRVSRDGSVAQQSQHPSPLIYIFTFVNNSRTDTMVDTGSTISAMNASYARRLNLYQHVQPTHTTCRTANNGNLSIEGRLSLPIIIANTRIIVDIFIIEDLCVDLLLGGDFCNKYDVTINFSRQCLSMQARHQQITIKFQPPQTQEQVFYVKTIADVVIPPKCSKVIQAKSLSPSMAAVFTPSPGSLNKRQVTVPHAILTINDDQSTILTLLNVSESPQMVPKGTTLGQVSHLDRNRCCSIHIDKQKDYQSISSITDIRTSPNKTVPPSLKTELHALLSHLPLVHQKQIFPTLSKHVSVFDTSCATVISTENVSHRIPIHSHHPPIQSYPYRRSQKETTVINEQVKLMLANHIIRPSSSPWSSPVVIIQKKDGSPRFCVDYRRLNLITERDVYPLPRIDDIIDRLAGSQFFSTFDLKAGYWQIPIAEDDKKKTAFCTTEGLFEFNVLPFGLSNAPASFQRTINSILGTLRWDMTLVYLDDIIVYSPSFNQHIQHLDLVLTALNNAHVKLNLAKCSIAKKQIDYLGFRITTEGIKPTTANVKKTVNFPTPTSSKAAYSFVQMAQFYRKFIKDFASIAAPLIAFKDKNIKFCWTDECQKSFDTLKQRLSQFPLLAFYTSNSKLKLKINTDASNAGIGGVLHQITPDGRTQPVQYLSRSLSKREQKYSVVEKECLAMVWCITKLRPYLYGQKFTLLTDHHPLCWLNKQSSKNGRLDRWSLQLQEYSFDIKHTPGTVNCVADCLSRYPTSAPDDLVEKQLELVHGEVNHIIDNRSFCFDPTLIHKHQQKEPDLQRLSDQLSQGMSKPPYILHNGLVHKVVQRRDGRSLTLTCIPPSIIQELLKAYHDSPTGGHLGVHKTWNRIRNRYFWPDMFNSIRQYIRSCTKCQQFKVNRTTALGTLQPIEPPSGILDLMGLDFLGPVQLSNNGNKYILVCTDYLSKFAITQATPNCSAETAAKFLVERVILQYGVPKQLITDQGTHFMSNVFRTVAARCGAKHITTTTYHPQSNGLTERFNATLVGSLSTYVNQQQTDWDEYLPYATFAYNTATQASTQFEPFKLMYGRDPMLPFDMPHTNSLLPITNDYYQQLKRFLNQAKSSARCNITRTQNLYKKTYDTGRMDLPRLKLGQLILVKQMMLKHLRKFSPKYYGPFKVVKHISRLNYQVQHVADGHMETVHVSRIRVIP